MHLGALPIAQTTAAEALAQAMTPRLDARQDAAKTAETSELNDRAARIATGADAPQKPDERAIGASLRASSPPENAALTSAVMADLATSISTGQAQTEEAATQQSPAKTALDLRDAQAEMLGKTAQYTSPPPPLGAQETAVQAAVDRAQTARSSEPERAILEQSAQNSANTSAALADTQAAFRAGEGYTKATRALAETTKLQTTRTDFFAPSQAEQEAAAAERSATVDAAKDVTTERRAEQDASERGNTRKRLDMGLDGPALASKQGAQGPNSPVERAYREAVQIGAVGNAAAEQMGQMAGPSAAEAAEAMRAG